MISKTDLPCIKNCFFKNLSDTKYKIFWFIFLDSEQKTGKYAKELMCDFLKQWVNIQPHGKKNRVKYLTKAVYSVHLPLVVELVLRPRHVDKVLVGGGALHHRVVHQGLFTGQGGHSYEGSSFCYGRMKPVFENPAPPCSSPGTDHRTRRSHSWESSFCYRRMIAVFVSPAPQCCSPGKNHMTRRSQSRDSIFC